MEVLHGELRLHLLEVSGEHVALDVVQQVAKELRILLRTGDHMSHNTKSIKASLGSFANHPNGSFFGLLRRLVEHEAFQRVEVLHGELRLHLLEVSGEHVALDVVQQVAKELRILLRNGEHKIHESSLRLFRKSP